MDMQVLYVVRYEGEVRREQERAAEARKAWLDKERELAAPAQVPPARFGATAMAFKRLAGAVAAILG